ncbi:MAG: hypothetical protein RIQ72_437 [Candidatus Parcubacteria bacterium]|jgi:hypothetical protein
MIRQIRFFNRKKKEPRSGGVIYMYASKLHIFVQNRIYKFLLLSIIFFGALSMVHIVYAQSTMSGGGYALDGSMTVFTTSANGTTSGYSVANTGDPISTQNSTGGIYTLSPSPFDIPPKPQVPTSNIGMTSGGFTQIQGTVFASHPSGTTSISDFDIYKNRYLQGLTKHNRPSELFNTKLDTGLEWSDTGTLVQIDQNGSTAQAQSKSQLYPGDLSRNDNVRIREYQTVTAEQKKMIYLALFLFAFARLFKKKKESVIHRHGDGFIERDLHQYIVSRYPGTLFVDYIVVLHKNTPLSTVGHGVRNVKDFTGILGFFISNIVVTILSLCAIVLTYQVSFVLSLIFSLIFAIRVFIWYKL